MHSTRPTLKLSWTWSTTTVEGNHIPNAVHEGHHWPNAYYRTVDDDHKFYMDHTGTGNSLNVRHPHSLQLTLWIRCATG